jgi:hypothetical protein
VVLSLFAFSAAPHLLGFDAKEMYMPKNTPPDIREIEEFWRNGEDARASEDAPTKQRLLIELVYAANSLATHAIRRRPMGPTGVADDRFMYDCRECFRVSEGGGPLQHKPSCRVGRVLAVIGEIQGIFPADAPAKDAGAQGGAQ